MTNKARRSRRGEGTVVKVRTGLYRAQVSLGVDRRSGNRVRWSAYAPTEDEARRKRAGFLAKHRRENPSLGDPDLTVNAWLDRWITQQRDNERTHYYRVDKLRPVRKYLGKLKIHALQQKDVERLINVDLQAQRIRGHGSTAGQPRRDGENMELVPLKTRLSRRTLPLSAR